MVSFPRENGGCLLGCLVLTTWVFGTQELFNCENGFDEWEKEWSALKKGGGKPSGVVIHQSL